ncbi:hypothetical protein [Geminicoccus harenae]|uniref:hypothetical protein n=1 Tax=Geminicoccus harenae TaxID=2498453 RepID=UPI001C95D37B|nr:hypothetical protein [Geminicoccus harenae]
MSRITCTPYSTSGTPFSTNSTDAKASSLSLGTGCTSSTVASDQSGVVRLCIVQSRHAINPAAEPSLRRYGQSRG